MLITPIRMVIKTPHGTQTIIRDGAHIILKMENLAGRSRVVRNLETVDGATKCMSQLYRVASRFNGHNVLVSVA